jgi:hypothetical protein
MPDPRDRERQRADPSADAPNAPLGGPPPPDAPRLDETVEGGLYYLPIGNTGETRAVDAEGKPVDPKKAARGKE